MGEAPEHEEDVDLWSKVLQGDAHSYGILFERHVQAVFGYCFRRTADRFLAEDLTSIVFMETWRRRNKIEVRHGTLLVWLYGVANNVLRNQARSTRRYKDFLARLPRDEPVPDSADEAVARIDDERRMRVVLEKIGDLSTRDQEIVTLCLWEGLSYEDAARSLGIPMGTVRSRLSRARQRLQDVFREPADVDGHNQGRTR
jgi:RNA polymerase sigma-70 factor (ECF subfamily)